MGLARLVAIEGPDLGAEFEIPLRGGAIGRGEGCVVQLSDMTVSRTHCLLELRDGRLCVVDEGSRNRTLVNGQPVTVHTLVEGDEIVVGGSRLAFLPGEGGVAVLRQSMPARVTMEIGSRELLAFTPSSEPDQRARRHLAALAALGDDLRRAETREALGRAAGDACRQALAADRVFLLLRDAAARMVPAAIAVAADDPAGQQLSLPREAVDKAVREGKALILGGERPAAAAATTRDSSGLGRPAMVAPLSGLADEVAGLLYVERRSGGWDAVDLMAANCVAHLTAAALLGLDRRDALVREKTALEERVADGEFVGSSAAARAVLDFVAKVGPTDATILLGGESGSGKEMVARAIHRASRRRGGPCIAVNCAALTESLIESELFGHEKGAFTGATERKLGRFELADKGTLFLDEIGELPLQCQTKFLRVLEEQRFERVGGSRSVSVDVRVVAATNRDLADMVRRGGFREDLYYRLSVIHAVVPPLRQRVDDIPTLAEHFLARFRQQASRRITGFRAEAMRALMAHPWPGNVRELRNAVERAVVLGEGELIRVEDLPPQMVPAALGAAAPALSWTAPRSSPTPPFGSMAIGGGAAAPVAAVPAAAVPAAAEAGAPAGVRSLRELEREGIVAALAATGGNKAQAAAMLAIDRSTLYKKLKEYGIG